MSGKKPKILIIGTGGTIGARKEGGLWKYGELAEDELLNIVAGVREKFDIKTRNIFRMDSAEMTPQHWLTLANTIYYSMKDYDGIVVTMGTDILGYAVAAVSFLIQNANIPIVFTGSQVDTEEITSDAMLNLRNAISIAGTSDIAEIIITFNGKIIKGTRARKVNASDFNGFESIGEPPLGRIEHSAKFYFHYKKRRKSKPILYNKLETQAGILKVYPGFDTHAIIEMVDKGVKGIVIEGYGLGLLPMLNNSMKEALDYARGRNVAIVLTSDCSLGNNWQYIYEAETGSRIEELKPIPVYDMLTETAYVKLMWVLAQTRNWDEVKKMMQKNYVGEITEFK